MSIVYYWAEMNSGTRYPTDSGTLYTRPQDMRQELYNAYGEDAVDFNINSWEHAYAPTSSGLKLHSIIYVSGVDVGTGYKLQALGTSAQAAPTIASSVGWTDFVTSNAAALS